MKDTVIKTARGSAAGGFFDSANGEWGFPSAEGRLPKSLHLPSLM
jgi:hypothetical protein